MCWLRAVLVAALAMFVVAPVMASTNAFNDDLLKKSPQQQRAVLQFMIGDGCRVTRAFFNGIAKRGPARGRAFWSAACADGRSFLVMITPRLEDTRVLECSKLKVLGIDDCFKKIKD